MRKVHENKKAGEVKLVADTEEDLWYLSTIIDPGDVVEGKTFRKIKAGDSEQENVKKPVFAVLKVESADLAKDVLRVSGIIVGGSEELPRGSHQSIKVELHEPILIRKEHWLSY